MTPAVFFKVAHCLVQNAEAKGHSVSQFYRIDQFVMCLTFINPEMLPLFTAAFEHLRLPLQKKWDFIIYICDHASINTPLKIPERSILTLKSRGEIAGLSHQTIFSSYNHHDGGLSLVNLNENIGIYWVRTLKLIPWWVAGSPLQRLISCWVRKHGFELTHAAAVGLENGGVLLAGKSGAGKSTTTQACLASDLFSAGEDYCLIKQYPQPYAYSIYNSSKLTSNTLQQFPYLASYVSNQTRKSHEKALIFQHQCQPERILPSFPLKAIMVLSISGNDVTTILPCSRGEALLSLSVSTIFQLATSGKSTLHYYANLLQQLPSYKLLLGKNQSLLVSRLKEFIQEQLT